MRIERSWRDGCVVVALTGQLTLFTAPQVKQALRKELGEQPLAVVCDLAGVESMDPVCVHVFSTVANHPASVWPGTALLLCGARPPVAEILVRLRVPELVRLCRDLDDALEHAVSRPPYLREQLRLAPTPTAPAAARRFVGEVCDYWRLAFPDEGVIGKAALLAGELAADAAAKARTEMTVRVELYGDRLYISVRDGSPRLLRLAPSGPRPVEELATAWGVQPHPDGGRVEWCTLDL
jgi:anti-anti-sigma regulatory factor